MAVDMNKVIDLCKSRMGKVTYSMGGERDVMGKTCDCSGMVFTAIERNGGTKKTSTYYTGNEHDYLVKNGFKLVYKGNFEKGTFNCKKGDVFIWAPAGANHTAENSDLIASAGGAG